VRKFNGQGLPNHEQSGACAPCWTLASVGPGPVYISARTSAACSVGTKTSPSSPASYEPAGIPGRSNITWALHVPQLSVCTSVTCQPCSAHLAPSLAVSRSNVQSCRPPDAQGRTGGRTQAASAQAAAQTNDRHCPAHGTVRFAGHRTTAVLRCRRGQLRCISGLFGHPLCRWVCATM
jgi:hypothetical protein